MMARSTQTVKFALPLVGVVDQGTTSSRFIVFDKKLQIVTCTRASHKMIYPKQRGVEMDAVEIIGNVQKCILEASVNLQKMGYSCKDVICMGITSQRETLIIWDKVTGKPLLNAIGWQDIRSAQTVRALIERTKEKKDTTFIKKCGLNISTYFTAVKIRWLMDRSPEIAKRIQEGSVMLGTMDTWVIYNLTGGPNNGIYVTDVTNASRTMLMDIMSLDWSDEMLDFFEIKKSILPKIVSSSEIYGNVASGPFEGIPISGCLGDQQAALLGNAAYSPGSCKSTYGTGIFILCNTGVSPVFTETGLLTTVAWKLGKNGTPLYALEGSIPIGGAVIEWMINNIQIVQNNEEANELSESCEDGTDVYFAPAFSGLFSPYWDNTARGCIVGLSHKTNRADIVRAGYDSMAYQVYDILEVLKSIIPQEIKRINVDGGISKSKIAMQISANILGLELVTSDTSEVTSRGTAIAAGLSMGVWESLEKVPSTACTTIYVSKISEEKRSFMIQKWRRAIKSSMHWETETDQIENQS